MDVLTTLVTALGGGGLGWFLGSRRRKAEARSIELENEAKSVENESAIVAFYKGQVDDLIKEISRLKDEWHKERSAQAVHDQQRGEEISRLAKRLKEAEQENERNRRRLRTLEEQLSPRNETGN